MSSTRKTAIVTGASQGIGAGIVKAFVERGFNVVANWLQKTQPRLLVVWGKHDLSFDFGEPERYRRDVSKAEVHVLDAGHFALDTKADAIAAQVREFMRTQK